MGPESQNAICEDFPRATLAYIGRRALGSFSFITVCEDIKLKAVLYADVLLYLWMSHSLGAPTIHNNCCKSFFRNWHQHFDEVKAFSNYTTLSFSLVAKGSAAEKLCTSLAQLLRVK
jgi:hypothetical protein